MSVPLLVLALGLSRGFPPSQDRAPSDPPTARFVDVTEQRQLGGGGSKAAWFDVDGDGWVDLLCGGVLWLNQGGQSFRRAAQPGQGLIADLDGDGRPDVFRFTAGVMLGDGEGGFRAAPMPELAESSCRGIALADFDGDGLCDAYAGGYEDWDRGLSFPDRLFLHDETPEPAGLLRVAFEDARHRARGVCAADFDEDGDADVYVSNYRLQPNVLWINDGAGALSDEAEQRGVLATSDGFRGGHGIGSCWADFDDDGRLDLFAGNFAHVDSRGDQPKSRFLRNLGSEAAWSFEDLGPCGLPYQESYASPASADFDGDGDLDLFFTTVYATASFGKKNHPVLLRNDGGFRFELVTDEEGLGGLPPTYQAAWADYDRDGDLDLMTAGRLFENRGAPPRTLSVDLRDETGRGPRHGIGAVIRLRLGERRLTRHVAAGTGEGNQDEPCQHFALGDAAGPFELEILWPGGSRQQHRVEEAGRITVLRAK